MRLLELNVQGYRSLKNVQWKPGALNVVIGPNGSGKSNLLRVIELLSDSAAGKLNEYIQSEGGMSVILWDDSSIDIDVAAMLSDPLGETLPDRPAYAYALQIRNMSVLSHTVRKETLLDIRYSGRSLIDKELSRLTLMGTQPRILNGHPHLETVLSAEGSQYGGDVEIYDVKTYLINCSIYQEVAYPRQTTARLPQIARFNNRVAIDGQNLVSVLHTLYTGDRDFKTKVNEGMRAAFGNDFEELTFPPAADQRIQMRVRWKTLKREQSAADLSDGTLRFLFLITVLASPEPPPLIAIDEPETGLHPSMMPIIAEYAVEAAQRTQVIFTTHSAAFLDAFPKESRPTITVARWEDGETKLQIVNDDELKRFLERYTLGDLYRSGELESELFAE